MKKEAEKYQALINIKNALRFINEWTDTQEMVNSLLDEIHKVIQVIDNEIERFKDKSEAEFLLELQPWFRIAIRSTIATLEAICYRFKHVTILICDHRGKTLTKNEREKLLEKKQDEGGKVQNYYLETTENIKFTLKMFYYAFDLSFEIKDHEGWKKLLNTIEIRHKLTHPKNKEDLYVSPQKYNDASIGFNWFEKQLDGLLK